jgi:hypothetical protein
MTIHVANCISKEHIKQYHNKGFVVVEHAVSVPLLDLLREDCNLWISYTEARFDLIEHLGCIIGKLDMS